MRKLYATVTIDVQEAFYDLSSNEQQQFIMNNIAVLKDDNLIFELESRGYQISYNN